MSKHKFQKEMDAALAPVLPYLAPEKLKKKRKPAVISFPPHLVSEEHLMKTNKLPPSPVIGKLPYINMNSVGIVIKNLVLGQCWIAALMCGLFFSLL